MEAITSVQCPFLDIIQSLQHLFMEIYQIGAVTLYAIIWLVRQLFMGMTGTGLCFFRTVRSVQHSLGVFLVGILLEASLAFTFLWRRAKPVQHSAHSCWMIDIAGYIFCSWGTQSNWVWREKSRVSLLFVLVIIAICQFMCMWASIFDIDIQSCHKATALHTASVYCLVLDIHPHTSWHARLPTCSLCSIALVWGKKKRKKSISTPEQFLGEFKAFVLWSWCPFPDRVELFSSERKELRFSVSALRMGH